ncbi:MAG: hypothetical protein HGB12_17650 [Bacteroidetes bacterium]|nr:hypothetical protein [Bacteroidota bacterium]
MIKQLHYILLLNCILFANIVSYAEKPDSITYTNKIISTDIANSFFNNILSNPAYTGIFNGHNIRINAEIDKPFLLMEVFIVRNNII